MKTNYKLQENDNFVRYCKPNQWQNGVVLSSAFKLRKKNEKRPKDEKTLSVDWYEFFSKNHYLNIKKALTARNYPPDPKGCLVKLNTGKTLKKLKSISEYSMKSFYVEVTNESHSEICGIYKIDSLPIIYNSFIKNIDELIKVGDI